MGFAEKEKTKADFNKHIAACDRLCEHLKTLQVPQNTTSAGLGKKEGKISLTIVVKKKTPEIEALLPKEFEGYPIETIETGSPRHAIDHTPRSRRGSRR